MGAPGWAGLAAGLAWLGLAASTVVAIPPQEAARNLGRTVSVEGFVEKVVCSPRACLLSFEAGWSGLVAMIPSSDLGRFPEPKASYERQNVRIRGVIEDRQGRLRLELTAPSKIEVVGKVGASGSQVLSAEARPAGRGADAGRRPGTQVQISGGGDSAAAGAPLGDIVRDLQQEAAVTGPAGGGGASELAVSGLRERVAVQSETIRTLEAELVDVHGRLQDLEGRPAPVEEVDPSIEDVPKIERWVVPARRGLSAPRPHTGWSTDRLVRELGPPVEVSELARDRSLWVYGEGRAVTVVRGRVISSAGF